jgi:S1-C subfamily serine protease
MMKQFVALAAIVVVTALTVAKSAEAGKENSQPISYVSQSAQNQSYKRFTSGKLNYYPEQASPAAVTQIGLIAVPEFGFESAFGRRNDALGEHVTEVEFGGAASRLGLARGDVIIGVNGQELRTASCWYSAIHRAAGQDGWVTLKILDGRTGKTAYRTANVFQLK